MPAAPKTDWSAARLDYEVAGLSQGAIARKYGVSRRAVQQHIEREGWTLNVRATVQRETEAKVAGIVAGDSPALRERKLDEEAARRAELIKRHRLEWDFLRSYMSAAMAGAAKVEAGKMLLSTGEQHQEALRQMRFAKVATDALRARQEAERVAFGLDQGEGDNDYDELPLEHAAIRIVQILNAAGQLQPSEAATGIEAAAALAMAKGREA